MPRFAPAVGTRILLAADELIIIATRASPKRTMSSETDEPAHERASERAICIGVAYPPTHPLAACPRLPRPGIRKRARKGATVRFFSSLREDNSCTRAEILRSSMREVGPTGNPLGGP